MTKKILFIILIAFGLFACNSGNKEKSVKEGSELESAENKTVDVYNTTGYELMQQKCFICHFEKPEPSKKDNMIAPPMLRIQEHYKPSYPDKDEFVKAIIAWVKKPSEDKTLMPGAVRKFKLMTKLPYEDADLKLIAEVLYDIDFGEMPKMQMDKKGGLKLNDGKKWKLNPNSIVQVNSIIEQLEDFSSNEIASYNQLGRDVFDRAKTILLDESYTDELFEQLHVFFNNIEDNMHLLIASNSIEDAKKQQEMLKTKFEKFKDYFE
jgi:hypothetical protein